MIPSNLLENLLAGRKKKKRKFTLKSKYPKRIEQQYKKKLQQSIAKITRQINSDLIPLLKKRNDSIEDDILRAIDKILNSVNTGLTVNAEDIAAAVEANKVDELAKTIGVDLFAKTASMDFSEIIRVWAANQQLLITKMTSDYISRVSSITSAGFKEGLTHKVVAKEIRSATGINMRKAALIARNEIGNLNGQITVKRNQDLGIKAYIWRTARDERVRGNPSGLYPKANPNHHKREGKTYSFKEGAGARDKHPAYGINCRCFAESVIVFDD